MFDENDPIFEEENQTKLIEQIETAPDCRIFGVSRVSQKSIRVSMAISLVLALVLFVIAIIFYHPIFTFIFLAIVGLATLIALAILSYLNFAHNYYTTFVSELGIAKKSVWDEGAIPWEKIEYIEINPKDDGFEHIIFRSGIKTLGYRNSHFATLLSLKIISEFIGGIESWCILDDLKELPETVASYRYYMRPDIDKSEGKKKLEDIILREWIGAQDFDAYQTQEQTSAKSDEELYELIQNDPQCECIFDSGNFGRFFGNHKVVFVLLAVSIAASIGGIFLVPFAVYIYCGVVILFALMFYGMFKGDEKLVISPVGIARYIFGSPEALEWHHVEYIDFHTDDTRPIPMEFFGNQRRIFCPEHKYKNRFSIDLVHQYIPNLDEWTKTTKNTWSEGTYRLTRTDE